MNAPVNILVIRLHRLGDVLQLFPLLRALKHAYPRSCVHFLTARDYAPLCEGSPWIDRLITIPETQYRHDLKQGRGARVFNGCFELIGDLMEAGFDLIINRQYETGGLLAYLIGGKKVVGGAYDPDRGHYFTDAAAQALFETVRSDRRKNRTNLVDWSLRIAGIQACPTQRYLVPTREGRLKAQELDAGPEKGPRPVAVQIGASRSFRQWGIASFGSLIEWLTGPKERNVILVGSAEERPDSELLVSALSDRARVLNLVGKTDLPALTAVLAGCEVLISGDTGPMHLAAMAGTRVLGLFYGTAYPWETAPYGPGHLIVYPDLPCAPCLNPRACPKGHACKKALTPSSVQNAFEWIEPGGYPPGDWAESYRTESSGQGPSLYVTAFDHNGEQELVPVQEAVQRAVPGTARAQLSPARSELPALPFDPALDLESILREREGAIDSLLCGKPDEGFQQMAHLLESCHRFVRRHPSLIVKEDLMRFMALCARGLQNGDPVVLADALCHAFPFPSHRQAPPDRPQHEEGGTSA